MAFASIQRVNGITVKSFITARINLEAKRMLAHMDLPISAMAEKLGFEETTDFTNFFKREIGYTSSEFRQRQFFMWQHHEIVLFENIPKAEIQLWLNRFAPSDLCSNG